MVGVKFTNIKNESSRSLIKLVNTIELFTVNSYEIKREVNSDMELKKHFLGSF